MRHLEDMKTENCHSLQLLPIIHLYRTPYILLRHVWNVTKYNRILIKHKEMLSYTRNLATLLYGFNETPKDRKLKC